MNIQYILAVISVLLLTSLSITSAQVDGEILTVSFGDATIASFDPIFIRDTISEQVLRSMYVGLTQLDPMTNSVQPAFAKSWSRTFLPNDTILYRFDVPDDINWVRYDAELDAVVIVTDEDGNPRTVTKQDIAYGILRALDPEFASEDSYVLAESIYNGVAYLNGEVPVEEVGVVINLNDVSVVASSLDVDLPAILSQIQFMPQPAWLINEVGLEWTSPENFVSFGPYVMKSWATDVEIVLVSNPYWLGLDGVPQPHIETLRFVFLAGDDSILSYQAGEIDVLTNMTATDIQIMLEEDNLAGEFSQYPSNTTHFLGLNLREGFPTSNLAFRQALSSSLNREVLAQLVLNEGHVWADNFIPPSVLDAPIALGNASSSFDGSLSSDVEFAKAQLELAKTELGLESVAIDLIYRNTDFYKTLAATLAEMWQSELGITVNLLPQDYDGSLSNRQYAAVWVGEWIADALITESYYAPFLPDGDLSTALAFGDPNFDALFADTYDGADVENRDALLSELAAVLSDRVLIIPISWTADSELTQSYISRTPTVNGIRDFASWRVTN